MTLESLMREKLDGTFMRFNHMDASFSLIFVSLDHIPSHRPIGMQGGGTGRTGKTAKKFLPTPETYQLAHKLVADGVGVKEALIRLCVRFGINRQNAGFVMKVARKAVDKSSRKIRLPDEAKSSGAI